MRCATVKEAVIACPNSLTARWINVKPTETIISCREIGKPTLTVLPTRSVFHL